jgi:putative ABC transport system permease protein
VVSRELARAAVESIRAHALRSALTLLGVVIGVTTIVGVASVIAGLDAFVREKVILLSPDVFVVTKFGVITSREEFFEALKRPDLTLRDFDVLASRLTRAEALAADVTTQAAAKRGDRRLGGVTTHGTSANYGSLMNLDLAAGRYFAEVDDTAAQRIAVIGWDVKDELFGALDPVGREFTLNGIAFRVVGVIAQQGRSLGPSLDTQVFVPLRTFRQTWGTRNSVDFLVKARGGVPGVETASDEVRAVLRALRHTPFRASDPFGIVTAEGLQTLWRQISTAAFLLTLLISGVSLGVGGIVIANIMLVGVVERTKEIGVRLALGARKRDIRRQFLLEAALLAAGGGAAGLALGAGAAFGVQAALDFPVRVTPAILGAAFGLAVLVGLTAGYFPARNASNLVVVDALRDEV